MPTHDETTPRSPLAVPFWAKLLPTVGMVVFGAGVGQANAPIWVKVLLFALALFGLWIYLRAVGRATGLPLTDPASAPTRKLLGMWVVVALITGAGYAFLQSRSLMDSWWRWILFGVVVALMSAIEQVFEKDAQASAGRHLP